MRYAIFSDIHANLEALEAVLAKIDELAQDEPIDQIWFLGDLVGYGPNPNECIVKLRERTDVVIAGNHDWAAVGKIDLEDFSEAARISAEWTAEQLTEEHRQFLINLPERFEMGECTLVHGSPYGPLWEYLTSEVLAERSFQYFTSRYCLVGHTHVPIIFQQPDVSNTPTTPLGNNEQNAPETLPENKDELDDDFDDDDETVEIVAVRPTLQSNKAEPQQSEAHATPHKDDSPTEPEARIVDSSSDEKSATKKENDNDTGEHQENKSTHEVETTASQIAENPSEEDVQAIQDSPEANEEDEEDEEDETTPENVIENAEDRLNQEIEELLALLGLSQSMVQVSNEMIIPPEGEWHVPTSYRAIINPGGVGQPRDGDPRAAFMIYDTERGFTFYRVPYAIEKTQEKIIKVGLPRYLATRLAYGR